MGSPASPIRLGRHTITSGALLAFAAAPLAVVPTTLQGTTHWQQLTAVALALAFLLSSTLVVRRSRLGRGLATIGIVGTPCLGLQLLLGDPLFALTAGVVTLSALSALWSFIPTLPGHTRLRNRPVWSARATGASLVALALWTLWPSQTLESNPGGAVALWWSFAIAILLGAFWAVSHLLTYTWRASALLLLTATCCVLAGVTLLGTRWTLAPLGLNALGVLLLVRRRASAAHQETTWDVILGHPERSFVGTFAVLCLVGTLLLAQPISSATDQAIPLVDAVFTSTSAVCVTGLIVQDTPHAFSAFGQATILGLIQLGGLGVMTFYTFAFWAFRRRMSLRYESAVSGIIGTGQTGGAVRAVKQVLLLTFAVEALGWIALTGAFIGQGDSVGVALWRGLFTSISAFCNAGFALQSDSLVGYQHSPVILHVTSLLIILGGLSPAAIAVVPALLRRSSEPISAQARLCLVVTGVLLAAGFLFYVTFEWNASLAGLSFTDKLHNAWFQSATLRTAGFNSVGIETARAPTMTLMMVWMFIGGNPGGTAGGIKTTTLTVLLLTVVQSIRGRTGVEIFRKSVAAQSRTKATTVVLLAILSGGFALVAMQLTQKIPTGQAIFEVVSALGTVGLSVGGTAQLDGIGKLIIIGCMFVGRVGGLTLLMFLSTKNTRTPVRWPEEDIDVG